MRIILCCLAMLLIFAWAVPSQAIQKVPKQGKQDTARTESPAKTEAQKDTEIKPPAKDEPRVDPAPPPKDCFIDKDGDGINDNLAGRKPPEIKKHQQPREHEPQPSKAPERKEADKPEAGKQKSKR